MKTSKDPIGVYPSRLFRRGVNAPAEPVAYVGTIALVCLWLLLMATYWIW